jgi:hypothetical protein
MWLAIDSFEVRRPKKAKMSQNGLHTKTSIVSPRFGGFNSFASSFVKSLKAENNGCEVLIV